MEKTFCQNSDYFRYHFIKNDIHAFVLYLQKAHYFKPI